MTLVLDSGGVSALAGNRARLLELRNRGMWPPQVPVVVLVEALTGDVRRDFHTDRLLRMCQIREVGEHLSRRAARLRTGSGKASSISAVDALVVAFAESLSDPVVLTSDPGDLGALAEESNCSIRIVPV